MQAWPVENRAGNTKLLLSEHYSEPVLERRRKAGPLAEGEGLDHLNASLHAMRYFERRDQSDFRSAPGRT